MRTALNILQEQSWTDHVRKLQNQTQSLEDLAILPFFRCFVCGAAFSSRLKLRDHESIAHKMFRCSASDCCQSFMDLRTLTLHETAFHETFTCAACSCVVAGSGLIHKHLHEAHGQQVPFVCVCGECGVFFLNPSDHGRHRLEFHSRQTRRVVRIGGIKNGHKYETDVNKTVSEEEKFLRNFVEQLLMDVPPHTPETIPPTSRDLCGRNLYQFDQVD